MVWKRNRLTILRHSGRKKAAASDLEGAIAYLTGAIDRRLADKRKIDPDYKNRLALVYNGRGLAKFALGDYKGAIADCDEAIENEDISIDTFLWLCLMVTTVFIIYLLN